MQKLNESDILINVDNLYILQSNTKIRQLLKKYGITNMLKHEQISDILFDVEGDSSPDMFQEMYNKLHDEAFADFVSEQQAYFSKENTLENQTQILSKAKAINNVHKVIYRHKYQKRKDSIQAAATFINKGNQLLKLFSPTLNGIMGGWTRGFAGTVLGRGGHCKSTFMTFDSCRKITASILDRVDIIAVEEQEEHFWQRIFASTFKIPIKLLREGIIKIAPEQINKVKQLYENRLVIHNLNKYNDIMGLIFTLKSQYIWIDHINAIEYPGKGNAMQNMIGGIPQLLNNEVQYFELHPESVIINLSQVNEQSLLARTGRSIWKHPSYIDAYGSQILHKHSREYLTFYYPSVDVANNPVQWTGKKELNRAGKQDLFLKIEKSSFGNLAEIRFKYNEEFGTFEDVDMQTNIKINDVPSSDLFNKWNDVV